MTPNLLYYLAVQFISDLSLVQPLATLPVLQRLDLLRCRTVTATALKPFRKRGICVSLPHVPQLKPKEHCILV